MITATIPHFVIPQESISIFTGIKQKVMREPVFYNYILTNWKKTVLYTGMTNNLAQRLLEHWYNKKESFTSKYKVYYLVWYQETKYILNAINLEKEIKSLSRERKNALIESINPGWKFFNETIIGRWPPESGQMEKRE